MEKGRLETISDSVFAVAMTLLVFDLQLPTGDQHTSFTHYFATRWPHYVGFVLTFAMISMIWVRHHWIFRQLRKADNTLLALNLVLLALVVFLPFPTATLASYLRNDSNDKSLAVGAYGAVILAIAIVLAALWLWAQRESHLLRPEVTDADVGVVSRRLLVAPALYLVGLVVSWFSVAAGLVVYFAVALSYLWHPAVGVDRHIDRDVVQPPQGTGHVTGPASSER